MFSANARVENIADIHPFHVPAVFVSIVHVNSTIKYDEYFLAIVRVPFVWFVRPM